MRTVKNALWKDSATPEERAAVERIDHKLEQLRARSRALARERYAITNRATVRTRSRVQAGHDPASLRDFRSVR